MQDMVSKNRYSRFPLKDRLPQVDLFFYNSITKDYLVRLKGCLFCGQLEP